MFDNSQFDQSQASLTENILLYFSDTGRGHRSATEALEEALLTISKKELNTAINIAKEAVAENSHLVNRTFVQLYNYLLRNHQHLMKYYYGFLHLVKPGESPLGYALSGGFLRSNLLKHKPSIVVSMHPMTNHHIVKAMKDVGLYGEAKFIVVITDPNKDLWRAWACEDADVLVAPNELVKDQLIEWGMQESKILVLGMPVHPDFLREATVPRSEFLSSLGLSNDLPTICINSGWAGGGNMLSAYKALNNFENKFQIIFLCGHNNKLYEKACAYASESNVPTAVLPFHDRMPDLMSAVDAMVTKAGGLTTFECIAKHLPIIFDVITEPMPQERGTVDLLVDQGLAKALKSPEELAQIIKNVKHIPNRNEQALPRAFSLDKTNAIFDIARCILQNTNYDLIENSNREKTAKENSLGQ